MELPEGEAPVPVRIMIYVGLDELRSRRELLVKLSFPSENLEYALKMLEDLERLGVKEIAFAEVGGRLDPLILGKGYRGFVLRARLRDRDAALKILRTDSTISSLEREAEATYLANRVNVGPLLLGYSSRVLVLELVEGASLDRWLEKMAENDSEKLRGVLRDCFRDARKLDVIGLDHGELSDVKKHVIVRPSLRPVIIDFGKASARRRPSNVTSLFSYLNFGPHSRKILSMLGVDEPPLIEVKEYKRRMDQESFMKLIRALNLA